MAFAGLFSSPPNTGPHVSDCPSNEREKAEADEAVVNHQRNKKKKKKKRTLDGKGNTNDSTLQHNHVPSPGGPLDIKQGPRVPKKTEWFWDYGSAHFSEKNSVSVNPRKRKLTKDHLGHGPKKQDFSSELEQYLQVRHAPPKPPPEPPVAVHPQQMGASPQRRKKKKKKRKKGMETGQENSGKAELCDGNPGTAAYGKRWPQSGRDGKDMRHDRGVSNNQSYGRSGWNGRTGRNQKSGKGEATPKEKKVFLSEDYLAKHTVEAQGRRICKYFLRGECQRGDQCNFEHDLSVKKLQVCKFYVQGFCNRETCIYMHRDFPCKFFHAGMKCFHGDACRFSHDPPTDLTRELLEQARKAEAELNSRQKNNDSSPLPPIPPPIPSPFPSPLLPPTAPKLTVEMTADTVTVRPNFYSSSPMKCQPTGSSTPPQSRGVSDSACAERFGPAESPHLERRTQQHARSPAVPDTKVEKNLEEPLSSPLAGPKPLASVLQSLFQHLSPTTELLRHTGVHASPFGSEGDSNGELTVAKTRDTIIIEQEDGGRDWPVYVEAEANRTASVPVYKPLSALDDELNAEDGRTLRDEPALVPLEAVIGIAQRDPRSVPSAVMVTLPLPHFARSVEWETREPLPHPPQVGVSTQKENPPPHLLRPLQDTTERITGSSPTPRNLPSMTTSAVHRLPVPALAGLIHPTHSKSKGRKSEGRNTEAGESQTKGSVLKGLFSSLLPSSDL